MLTIAHISCISFFLIGLIVYEIRQVATLPAWPHYPYFPYPHLHKNCKYRNKIKMDITIIDMILGNK